MSAEQKKEEWPIEIPEDIEPSKLTLALGNLLCSPKETLTKEVLYSTLRAIMVTGLGTGIAAAVGAGIAALTDHNPAESASQAAQIAAPISGVVSSFFYSVNTAVHHHQRRSNDSASAAARPDRLPPEYFNSPPKSGASTVSAGVPSSPNVSAKSFTADRPFVVIHEESKGEGPVSLPGVPQSPSSTAREETHRDQSATSWSTTTPSVTL
ncbi:MAG: hypothetical protein K0Q74_620 [Gammaproteobacteria bacterium]|nr:hypothetical protein [Gammaproteobacteria bacterium]